MFCAAVVNGASPIGTVCGLSSNDGFLAHALCILILTYASTPISKGGAVCGNPARTDLCGGRAVMLVPTATPSVDSAAGTAGGGGGGARGGQGGAGERRCHVGG